MYIDTPLAKPSAHKIKINLKKIISFFRFTIVGYEAA